MVAWVARTRHCLVLWFVVVHVVDPLSIAEHEASTCALPVLPIWLVLGAKTVVPPLGEEVVLASLFTNEAVGVVD